MWQIRMLVKQAGGDIPVDLTPDETTVSLVIPVESETATGTPRVTD